MRGLLVGVLMTASVTGIAGENPDLLPAQWLTVPERTAYRQTSTFDEVVQVIDALQAQTDLIHRETLLITQEGKDVPLLIVANPPINSPAQARASGKPVIYLQGNIHGGEVEGKEASLILLRDILYGDKRHLLNNQILLVVPIYNADGNDAMSAESRPSQELSPLLAGERFAHGYDLNRDGVAINAPETAALFRNVIRRWDPDLFVDLHTTNGSWHGYSLTWAPSYHTAGDPSTTGYTATQLLPAVQQTLRDKFGLQTNWFGDFDATQWPQIEFRTYHHAPRYLTNNMGLRNRMAILSETFAHDRFYKRIHAVNAFVEEILEFTNNNGDEIRAINRAADARVIDKIREQGGQFENGVRFEMVPLAEPIDLLSYTHIPYRNADGSTGVTRTSELVVLPDIPNYNGFVATKTATVPRAYVFPAQLQTVADKLAEHGVEVSRLEQADEFAGESFVVTTVGKQNFAQNGHRNSLLQGEFQARTAQFNAGDFYVSMEQRLANLIFYLLEPEADDGLAYWNFFDETLQPQIDGGETAEYPVFKVLR